MLLDIVLGYGSHEDMSSALSPTIKKVKADAQADGRELAIIATIVGTDEDPQDMDGQRRILEEAGVIICESNAQAVNAALAIIGKPLVEEVKPIVEKEATTATIPAVSKTLNTLLTTDKFINIGLSSFAAAITNHGGKVVQFDWQPVAGGNVQLQKALNFLNKVSLKSEEEING